MTVSNVGVTLAQPDMTLTSKAMLLALINQQNNLAFTDADVNIRPPQVIASPVEEQETVNGVQVTVRRDTSVEVDVLTDEVQDDFVTFTYERISLTKLFSVCNPVIREVDIKADGVVPVSAVVAEVLRKYGLKASEDEFSYTITQNQIVLTAKATNWAYTATATIDIEQSLLTRLAVTLLNGFEIPTEDPTPDLSARILATGKMGYSE